MNLKLVFPETMSALKTTLRLGSHLCSIVYAPIEKCTLGLTCSKGGNLLPQSSLTDKPIAHMTIPLYLLISI